MLGGVLRPRQALHRNWVLEASNDHCEFENKKWVLLQDYSGDQGINEWPPCA